MTRMKMTVPLLLMAGAGLLMARAVGSARTLRATETARRSRVQRESGRESGFRDSEPAAMGTPPRRWDIVDEQSDQSFPASDPPGNY